MRRTLLSLFTLAILGATAHPAFADIERMTINFAGGCFATSTDKCTIKVRATGTELFGDTVRLYRASSRAGTFRLVSQRLRELNSDGAAAFTFRNEKACYRARTGPKEPVDVVSNIICE